MPPKRKAAATAAAKKSESSKAHDETVLLGEITYETDRQRFVFVLLPNGHKMFEQSNRDLKRELEEFILNELPTDLESVTRMKKGTLKSKEHYRVDVQDKVAGSEEANVQIQLNIRRDKSIPHTTVASVLIPDHICMACIRQAFTYSCENCGTVRVVKRAM